MKRLTLYFTMALLLLCSTSCRNNANTKHKVERYSISDRTIGYWNQFNLRDTTLVGSTRLRQAFAQYILMLGKVTPAEQRKAIDSLCSSTLRSSKPLFDDVAEVAEKMLFDPNSPMRNDEIYLQFLESMLALPSLPEVEKIRPQYQLDIVKKNRVNTPATPFDFTLRDGSTSNLKKINSEYIILYFNNPDCNDCTRVKEILSKVDDPRITILSIYPDKDLGVWRKAHYPEHFIDGRTEEVNKLYDLKAIPTLYLLDSVHNVILKDATVESIIKHLMQ